MNPETPLESQTLLLAFRQMNSEVSYAKKICVAYIKHLIHGAQTHHDFKVGWANAIETGQQEFMTARICEQFQVAQALRPYVENAVREYFVAKQKTLGGSL